MEATGRVEHGGIRVLGLVLRHIAVTVNVEEGETAAMFEDFVAAAQPALWVRQIVDDVIDEN